MFARLLLIPIAALTAAAAPPQPIAERAAPAPGSPLFAIGDIHGDYQRLIRLLTAAHIIPAAPATPQQVEWTAAKAVLVVTGDMIDKGPRPVDVLRALAALRASAAAQGGQVILLAGNHEAEFLAGPDPKKAADFLADLKRQSISPADVVACRGDIGQFLCSLPWAARVGDWFFSHGGNTAGRTIPQLAADLAKGGDQLTGPNSLLEARLAEGKKWFASSSQSDHDVLAAYVAALGVKHMVQGHQPGEVKFDDGVTRHTGEMFQRYGLLFLIDVGMSEGVDDSRGAVLRIDSGSDSNHAQAICGDGSATALWDMSDHKDLGRALPCQ